jgi:hypothetical protein
MKNTARKLVREAVGIRAFKEILWPCGWRKGGSGLFGFWLRFGSVTGFDKPAPSPKPRQNTKNPRSARPQNFFKRSKVADFMAYFQLGLEVRSNHHLPGYFMRTA